MAVRTDPADLVTPSVEALFEAAVGNPQFFPWLAQHARETAGTQPPGSPWDAWCRRAQALADDLPALMQGDPT